MGSSREDGNYTEQQPTIPRGGQTEGRTEAAIDLPPQRELDYQVLSVKPAKKKLWRLERGLDPFLHLKRNLVMIQKLLRCDLTYGNVHPA